MTDFVIFKVAEDGEILEDITDVTEGSSFEDGLFQVPVFPPDFLGPFLNPEKYL